MGDEVRLLLVEADSEASHVLPLFLSRYGSLRTAQTRHAALESIRNECPDVLLLDPELPDGDGMDLIEEVRRRVPWAQVFIVCSAARAVDTGLFIESGANDVVARPFDVAAFLPRADRLCRSVGDRRQEVEKLQLLEARLRHVDALALLGTALATLSHEIANPLSVVRASAGYIKSDLAGDEVLDDARRQDLAAAAADVEEAAKAIRAFLTRVRGLSRRETPLPETTSLGPTLATALLFLKQKIRLSGVSLTTPLPEQTPTVSHISSRLVQAIANALSNAIESTGPGGNVVVRCLETEKEVVIEVEDDGPGLSLEMREQVSEAFFTTKPTGTGLGMSVIRDVMREHAGRYELKDTTSGKGLCVRLILPRD